MKRIILVLFSIILIIISSLSCNCITKNNYKIHNNGHQYYFPDNNIDYIVSIKDNNVIVNKLGYNYSRINLSENILKCNYNGKYFYFFTRSINGKIGVIKYNYNSGKYVTVFMDSGRKTGNYLCSVDKSGNYYFVDYTDRTLLHKYDSSGKLVDTYQFDSSISEIDTTNGKYQFILTLYGLYYIHNDKIYKTDNEYDIFPMTMINDEYYCGNGNIYSLFNNSSYGSYKENKTALLSNGIAKISGNKIAYTDFNRTNNKEYSFNSNINNLFGYQDRIIATIGSHFYTVQLNELHNKKSNNTVKPQSNDTLSIYSNTYDIDDKYITGICPNTTIATFKKNISYNGYDITFIKNSNMITSGKIGTGMIVKFTGNNEVIERIFIVKGDINCTGTINSKDTDLYMEFLLGLGNLSDEDMIACDINNDGTLDNSDLVLLAQLRE